jgi:hypothetical protein
MKRAFEQESRQYKVVRENTVHKKEQEEWLPKEMKVGLNNQLKI